MNTIFLIYLLTTHYIGDFILQTDWEAKNKSSRLDALTSHICSYGLFLTLSISVYFLFSQPNYSSYSIAEYCIFNIFAHFITDFFTSRLNAYLWNKKQVHNFFVAVGADGLIHQITLILSYFLFIN